MLEKLGRPSSQYRCSGELEESIPQEWNRDRPATRTPPIYKTITAEVAIWHTQAACKQQLHTHSSNSKTVAVHPRQRISQNAWYILQENVGITSINEQTNLGTFQGNLSVECCFCTVLRQSTLASQIQTSPALQTWQQEILLDYTSLHRPWCYYEQPECSLSANTIRRWDPGNCPVDDTSYRILQQRLVRFGLAHAWTISAHWLPLSRADCCFRPISMLNLYCPLEPPVCSTKTSELRRSTLDLHALVLKQSMCRIVKESKRVFSTWDQIALIVSTLEIITVIPHYMCILETVLVLK